MAEMELGYGSEYQLLRMLGHHRKYLDQQIASVLKTKDKIDWLDYPANYKRFSLDGEFKAIECFIESDNFKVIEASWNDYWPNKGNSQNWDGVFKVNGVWHFVEGKAHEIEAYSSCGATSENSVAKIKNAFEDTINFFNASETAEHWVSGDSKSYQLANRLAFINFCQKNGIKAKLVYINFLNGYEKKSSFESLSVRSESEWKEIWKKEYKDLGLNEEKLNGYLFHVYMDCKKI